MGRRKRRSDSRKPVWVVPEDVSFSEDDPPAEIKGVLFSGINQPLLKLYIGKRFIDKFWFFDIALAVAKKYTENIHIDKVAAASTSYSSGRKPDLTGVEVDTPIVLKGRED